jgi:DNA-binding transcriptional MerR regulator
VLLDEIDPNDDRWDQFITATRAACILGVPAETIRRWETRGKLTAVALDDHNRRLYTLFDVADCYLRMSEAA